MRITKTRDVVGRPPFLDQRLLKQQRLGFIGGDGGFHLGDTRHQRRGLRRQARLAEVTRQAAFQVLGFTDVEQARFAVEHAIHARTATAGCKERTRIEQHFNFRGCHFRRWRLPCRGVPPAGSIQHHC